MLPSLINSTPLKVCLMDYLITFPAFETSSHSAPLKRVGWPFLGVIIILLFGFKLHLSLRPYKPVLWSVLWSPYELYVGTHIIDGLPVIYSQPSAGTNEEGSICQNPDKKQTLILYIKWYWSLGNNITSKQNIRFYKNFQFIYAENRIRELLHNIQLCLNFVTWSYLAWVV